MDFHSRGKILAAAVIVVIMFQMLSCAWNRTRKFVNYESLQTQVISGWSFTPIIQSYHFSVEQGVPLDKNGVWLYIKANHPMIGRSEPLYGVDIDSIIITCADKNEQYIGVKYASVYGDVLDEENITNLFRFNSPTGEHYITIPPDVESINLEFDAVFYKGIYRSFRLSPDSDLMRDTVAVDTANPESFRKRVSMQLFRHESKTLIPAFL